MVPLPPDTTTYSVTKYFNEERDEIIRKLQQMDKNNFENWLAQLKIGNQEEFGDHKILERKKDKQKNEYIAIQENQKMLNESFQKFRRDTCCEINYKATTLIDMLMHKRFERIKSNGIRYLRIPKDKFDEMIKNTNDDIPEIEMDDVDDDE